MISFISTFPPIICGIGTYTKYIVENLPMDEWKVISFDLNQFSVSKDELANDMHEHVDYCLLFRTPCLPPLPNESLVWFQHAFGMWGNVNDHFLKLIHDAKRRGNKTVASLHTIHFQSHETPSGMCRVEEELLGETLPVVDALTVFTDGAYQAATEAFPQYADKIVVLRHGVHVYPLVEKHLAREKFLSYLIREADIPGFQKDQLKKVKKGLFSKNTLIIGNYGFITTDKDPLALYELGAMLESKLPDHRVIVIYAGIVQRTQDHTLNNRLPVLDSLRRAHDGQTNFFLELYIPEKIFPAALRALDFAVFWCNNATQSGRLAHAQGTGVLIAGRDCEGVGETLKLSGLPAATSLEGLAEGITEMVLEPGLKREVESRSRDYARSYSFPKQAQKHLFIRDAFFTGRRLPALDRRKTIPAHDHSMGLKEAYEDKTRERQEIQQMAA